MTLNDLGVNSLGYALTIFGLVTSFMFIRERYSIGDRTIGNSHFGFLVAFALLSLWNSAIFWNILSVAYDPALLVFVVVLTIMELCVIGYLLVYMATHK